ncbi:MAG: hypothetical protein H0W22_07340, partial [Chloroflexi bacterium]|nr:hypothetical protein [Chloroflexota bacterium]
PGGTTYAGSSPGSRPDQTAAPGTDGLAGAAATAAATPDADLADLGSIVGMTVRVGGLVVDVRPDGFVLDDGTAHAPVVLRDEATDWIPLIEPDDAINVIGRVERLDDGALGVVATDPAGIVLGSDPDVVGVAAIVPASPAGKELSAESRPRTAGLNDDFGVLPGAGAGLASLLGVSLASVGVTVLRRRQARRLLASRVAIRLASIGSSRPISGAAEGADGRPSEP